MKSNLYNQLMVFHTIAKHGSITNAAKQLQMTSPSVRNALKALEMELGLPLFTRTTRRIELTQAGALLLQQTTQPLTELSTSIEAIRDLSQTPSGKVSITLPKFVYQHFFKPHYIEFCQIYPDIELEISVSDATVDILAQGFDLGIRFGDKVAAGLVAKPLTKPMKEAFFASPDYIEKHGLPTEPEQLTAHKLVQYRFISSQQLVPILLQQGQQTIEVEMPHALIVNDTDVMLDAALDGLGIGRMVEPVVQELFDQGRLVPVLADLWYPYSGLYLYFHQHSQKAKRVRVLIDFLMQKLATSF